MGYAPACRSTTAFGGGSPSFGVTVGARRWADRAVDRSCGRHKHWATSLESGVAQCAPRREDRQSSYFSDGILSCRSAARPRGVTGSAHSGARPCSPLPRRPRRRANPVRMSARSSRITSRRCRRGGVRAATRWSPSICFSDGIHSRRGAAHGGDLFGTPGCPPTLADLFGGKRAWLLVASGSLQRLLVGGLRGQASRGFWGSGLRPAAQPVGERARVPNVRSSGVRARARSPPFRQCNSSPSAV